MVPEKKRVFPGFSVFVQQHFSCLSFGALVFCSIFLICLPLLLACKKALPGPEIRIAFQAWSFMGFSLEESAKQGSRAGFRYIEMYPDQKITAGSEATTHFSMSAENREHLRTILKANKLQLVQYGVVSCSNRSEWVQLFEFAKDMGIETIISEPAFTEFGFLDSLTLEYKIKLAIHNHEIPTIYWNPDIALEHLTNCGQHMGMCVDNGHWMRSGLEPVKNLAKTEGRLFAIHLKDMSKFDDLEAHTVPLGEGVLDLQAVLGELKRQHFTGVITLENEYNWDNPAKDLKKSLKKLKRSI